MIKKTQWVTVLYVLAILSPFFVPSMNTIEPKLGEIPFTLWWSLLMVALYCIMLKVWSNRLWDSFDGGKGEERA